VHTLGLRNPKVLIRPSQAESTKGKNVIIGDERPVKKMTQKKVPPSPAKVSTLGGKTRKRRLAASQLV